MLDRLPVELLRAIAHEAAPVAYRRSTHSSRSKPLLSLCLVSKRLRAAVQPLLVEVAEVRGPWQEGWAEDVLETREPWPPRIWDNVKTGVRVLAVSSSAWYAVRLPEPILSCAALDTLILDQISFDPTHLTALPNLRRLVLNSCKLYLTLPMRPFLRVEELSLAYPWFIATEDDALRLFSPEIFPKLRALAVQDVEYEPPVPYAQRRSLGITPSRWAVQLDACIVLPKDASRFSPEDFRLPGTTIACIIGKRLRSALPVLPSHLLFIDSLDPFYYVSAEHKREQIDKILHDLQLLTAESPTHLISVTLPSELQRSPLTEAEHVVAASARLVRQCKEWGTSVCWVDDDPVDCSVIPHTFLDYRRATLERMREEEARNEAAEEAYSRAFEEEGESSVESEDEEESDVDDEQSGEDDDDEDEAGDSEGNEDEEEW